MWCEDATETYTCRHTQHKRNYCHDFDVCVDDLLYINARMMPSTD